MTLSSAKALTETVARAAGAERAAGSCEGGLQPLVNDPPELREERPRLVDPAG
jgi:hypothetical protein